MGMFGEGSGGGGGIWTAVTPLVTTAVSQTVSVTGLSGTRFIVEIITPALTVLSGFYLRLNNKATLTEYPKYSALTGQGGGTNVVEVASSLVGIPLTGFTTAPVNSIVFAETHIKCDPAKAAGFTVGNSYTSYVTPAGTRQYTEMTHLVPSAIGAVTSLQLFSTSVDAIPIGTEISIWEATT